MTKVINGPAAEVPRTAKKAEGKKRKSPCTPYQGERNQTGFLWNRLSRARGMRMKLMAELDRDLAKHENLSRESAERRYYRHLTRLHEIFGVSQVG